MQPVLWLKPLTSCRGDSVAGLFQANRIRRKPSGLLVTYLVWRTEGFEASHFARFACKLLDAPRAAYGWVKFLVEIIRARHAPFQCGYDQLSVRNFQH